MANDPEMTATDNNPEQAELDSILAAEKAAEPSAPSESGPTTEPTIPAKQAGAKQEKKKEGVGIATAHQLGGMGMIMGLLELAFPGLMDKIAPGLKQQIFGGDDTAIKIKTAFTEVVGDIKNAQPGEIVNNLKQNLGKSLSDKGITFDQGDLETFTGKLDKMVAESTLKDGSVDKNAFIDKLVGEAKDLGVNVQSRFENKAGGSPATVSAESIEVHAGPTERVNSETLSYGNATPVDIKKDMNFSGEKGELTVYTSDENGVLEHKGEVSRADIEKSLGTKNLTVQTVSTCDEQPQGFFLSNGKNGYYVGVDAVKEEALAAKKNELTAAPKPEPESEKPAAPKADADSKPIINAGLVNTGFVMNMV